MIELLASEGDFFPRGVYPEFGTLPANRWRKIQLHRIDLVIAVYGGMPLTLSISKCARSGPAIQEGKRKRKNALHVISETFPTLINMDALLNGQRN